MKPKRPLGRHFACQNDWRPSASKSSALSRSARRLHLCRRPEERVTGHDVERWKGSISAMTTEPTENNVLQTPYSSWLQTEVLHTLQQTVSDHPSDGALLGTH